ncbi:SDR family NAD(P)-dependent oxidoreductase [Propylenella binzhouense]|uniref:SDR family oxidoreductase n=1 Tax=Propylenella binzhouense TaxID=2555902 RepID=A0A964T6B9_9HYPH|nr:SDR family oxidoreductase [Propylenella binzhouense]MYZ48629.1 SDR family oxidoreductase [Propylenella binzhouense]
MAEDGQPLRGKVALITGAARRIGRATALSLARSGASIVINARSSAAEIEKVADEVRALGAGAMTHLADVTDEEAVAAMFEAVDARFGRLDVLVNNAADRREAPLTEMSFADWRAITGTILDGAFLCARSALPLMVRSGGGVVINIGGMTGHTGAYNRAHVCTAKAGLVGLTKAIAVEFAGRGITANCVVPGKIGGERARSAGAGGSVPGTGQPIVGREGHPEEVAEMVRTLAVPTGRFITGQTIHVSGGMYFP